MLKSVTEAMQEYAMELGSADKNLIVFKHIEGFSGFRRNGINVIGARSFVGMTEFLLSIANELAGQGQKTLFVTTHNATNEVLRILLALINGIPFTEVTNSLIAENKIQNVSTDNLFIYEATVDEQLRIMGNLTPILVKHNIENLIIDKGNIDTYELSQTSEFKQVTIYLGQLLGISVDKHYWPTYKDFLKRGIVMEHVNVAIGLVRPEFYNIIMDENEESTKGVAEIVIVKSPFEEHNVRHRISQDANFKLPEWSP